MNGDRPRVASDLAMGAAQSMTGMAHYPALLWASPWELEEEMEDRETIPCVRNLGLAGGIQPESRTAGHQQRATRTPLTIDRLNEPAQRDLISSDAAIRARTWR